MSADVYTTIIAVLLGGAIACALYRVVKGPTAVDRAVANEVIVATMVCALGVEAALNRHSTSVPILMSLSLVGFLSSVAVARFAAREREGTQIGHDNGHREETP